VTGPVLVTGAAGFVGFRIVQALVARGHAVRALVHETPLPHTPPGVTVVRGDIREARRLAVDDVSAVVHCAALLDPIERAEDADAVNHQATVELARHAARAQVPCFVFVSSVAAIGFRSDAGLVGTDAPCSPTTAYGRSKRAAEVALATVDLQRLVVLRPPTVYGPGERMNFLALTRAVAGRVFPIPGSGNNRMSFCHVDNLADAVGWSLDEPAARGVLHIADAHPVTLREAVTTIGRALGRAPIRVPTPMPVARVGAVACELAFGALGARPPLTRARLATVTADQALDTSATKSMGFEPRVSFTDGVRETVEWYRETGLL
jgi:UDP-glucose 4-epimerase